MKRIALFLAAAVTLCLTACAQKSENKKEPSNTASKTLVVYFSATGTTESAAQKIASVTGGELRRIQPEKEYTAHDLDWTDKSSRSNNENNDPKSRPGIKAGQTDVAAYDTVYLGYPIWWDQAPRIINTFIEAADLKGKTVIPFATSGGSGVENSVEVLRKAYPDVKWQDGRLLNGASEEDIRKWVDGK